MDWIENFHDFLSENKLQFNLKYHMHSTEDETVIEVKDEEGIVIKVADSDYENCYKRAYEDLKLTIDMRKEKLTAVVKQFKTKWKEIS